jgi:hypothetical protein
MNGVKQILRDSRNGAMALITHLMDTFSKMVKIMKHWRDEKARKDCP